MKRVSNPRPPDAFKPAPPPPPPALAAHMHGSHFHCVGCGCCEHEARAMVALAAHRARSGGEDATDEELMEMWAQACSDRGFHDVAAHIRACGLDDQDQCALAAMRSLASDRKRLERMEKALGEIAADGIREPRRSDHDSDDAYWEACGAWRMTLKARAAFARTQDKK